MRQRASRRVILRTSIRLRRVPRILVRRVRHIRREVLEVLLVLVLLLL